MICPRCNSPEFHRVGAGYNYFECSDCGYMEEGGIPIREPVHKYKKCPRCGGKHIEPVYRRQGYYQCEDCGKEWQQDRY